MPSRCNISLIEMIGNRKCAIVECGRFWEKEKVGTIFWECSLFLAFALQFFFQSGKKGEYLHLALALDVCATMEVITMRDKKEDKEEDDEGSCDTSSPTSPPFSP